MNFASLTLKLKENPTAVEGTGNWFVSKAACAVAPAGKNRIETPIELHVIGNVARQFQENAKAGMKVFVNCGTLRHDLDKRAFSVMSASVEPVGENFKNFNEVVLAGRCIKDIDESNEKHVRRTPDGLLIVNQTLQVRTGDGQSDLFNLVAINGAQDKLQLGRLMADFTRKGSGLTVWARLSTRGWMDQKSGAPRSTTQLAVNKMTLPPRPPKTQAEMIQPKSSISEGSTVKSLWPTGSEGGWGTSQASVSHAESPHAAAIARPSQFQDSSSPADTDPF
jgi:single-stranded DNA-binding protein